MGARKIQLLRCICPDPSPPLEGEGTSIFLPWKGMELQAILFQKRTELIRS